METQANRSRIQSAEPFNHQPGPQPACGTEFRHFLQQIVVSVEKERQARRELVYFQPRLDGGLDICDAIRQGKGDLLYRGASGLAHVVPRNGYGIPERHRLAAILKYICDKPHRGLRGEDVGPACHVFLENVVLDRPAQNSRIDALPARDRDIHGKQNGGRGVDGHTRRDLIQRYAAKQSFHIFQARNRNAYFPDFAFGYWIVRVVTDLRWKIESHRKSTLTLVEQKLKAAIGFRRVRVSGVLTHGPQSPSIHRGLCAAREWQLPGEALVFKVVSVGEVKRLQPKPGIGFEMFPTLRTPGTGDLIFPGLFCLCEVFSHVRVSNA